MLHDSVDFVYTLALLLAPDSQYIRWSHSVTGQMLHVFIAPVPLFDVHAVDPSGPALYTQCLQLFTIPGSEGRLDARDRVCNSGRPRGGRQREALFAWRRLE